MIDRASGPTVAHLNVADVRDIELGCLHGRSQQDAIAEVLGALDDKIDANARMVPLLRDLAKVLLRRAADPAAWHVVGDVGEVRKGLSYTGAGLAETGMPMVNPGPAGRDGVRHYRRHLANRGTNRAGVSRSTGGRTGVEAAADLLRRAWLAERESASLAALRDTLLPPLLSGELRVRDAEAVLADAT